MAKKKNLIYCFLLAFLVLSFLFITPEKKRLQSHYHSSELQMISFVDGDLEIIEYANEDGENTIAADKGYAKCIIRRKGKTKLYTFFDDKGQRVSRFPGYYSLLREYDDNGNNISITYLDIEGKPCITSYNYAIEKRKYNENGQIVAVRFYDVDAVPITTEAFGNGKNFEYDKSGNTTRCVFVDALGNPIMTRQGYASIEYRLYSSDGSELNKVESEFYFDERGEPISLSLGQYGVYKEYDDVGRESLITYLDENGYPTQTNKGYATVCRTYQADNTVLTETYYDSDGSPISLKEGQYGTSFDNGSIVYLDKEGNKTINLKNLLYNYSWIVIVVALILVLLCNAIQEGNIIFLVLYVCIVLYLTLLFRTVGGNNTNIHFFEPYSSIALDSEKRAEALKNIWLFIPLGAVLYRVKHHKSMWLISVALSLIIETVQFFTGIGYCTVNDVINNGIGGWIGYEMAKSLCESNIFQFIKIFHKKSC